MSHAADLVSTGIQPVDVLIAVAAAVTALGVIFAALRRWIVKPITDYIEKHVRESLATVEQRSRQLETNGGGHLADDVKQAISLALEIRDAQAAVRADAREAAVLAGTAATTAARAEDRVQLVREEVTALRREVESHNNRAEVEKSTIWKALAQLGVDRRGLRA